MLNHNKKIISLNEVNNQKHDYFHVPNVEKFLDCRVIKKLKDLSFFHYSKATTSKMLL